MYKALLAPQLALVSSDSVPTSDHFLHCSTGFSRESYFRTCEFICIVCSSYCDLRQLWWRKLYIFSKISNAEHVFRDLYLAIYGLANLDFLQGILKPFCLAPNIDALHLILLEYIIAGLPLFLMLGFYLLLELYERGFAPVTCICRPFHVCFAYFKRKWNIQRSVIDGFATFIILSYSKFTFCPSIS